MDISDFRGTGKTERMLGHVLERARNIKEDIVIKVIGENRLDADDLQDRLINIWKSRRENGGIRIYSKYVELRNDSGGMATIIFDSLSAVAPEYPMNNGHVYDPAAIEEKYRTVINKWLQFVELPKRDMREYKQINQEWANAVSRVRELEAENADLKGVVEFLKAESAEVNKNWNHSRNWAAQLEAENEELKREIVVIRGTRTSPTVTQVNDEMFTATLNNARYLQNELEKSLQTAREEIKRLTEENEAYIKKDKEMVDILNDSMNVQIHVRMKDEIRLLNKFRESDKEVTDKMKRELINTKRVLIRLRDIIGNTLK